MFAGGDTDLYGYVLNDPVNFVDPWGLFRWHGNWGGPNWTAGQKKSWNDFSQAEKNRILNATDIKDGAPYDKQDEFYMQHDIAYGDCRDKCASSPCPSKCEEKCFNEADYDLANNLFQNGFSNPKWLPTGSIFILQPGYRNGGYETDGSYYQFRWEF